MEKLIFKTNIKMSKEEKEVTVKKQKASVSYAVKAFGKHVETLKLSGLVDEETSRKLDECKESIKTEYVKQLFG